MLEFAECPETSKRNYINYENRTVAFNEFMRNIDFPAQHEFKASHKHGSLEMKL